MNRELLTQVAEWLEAGAPHKAGISQFNMNYFVDSPDKDSPNPINGCGTACCIAGAAIQFHQESQGLPLKKWGWFSLEELSDLFEMPRDDTETLVYGYYKSGESVILESVTTDQAATVLRHLLKTGEVDWAISGAKTFEY